MGRMPLSGLPPTMLMRSMRCAPSVIGVCNALYATRQAKKRSAFSFVRIIRALVHRRTPLRGPGARLLLALAQVGPQLGGQTAAPILGSRAFRALSLVCHGSDYVRRGCGTSRRQLPGR